MDFLEILGKSPINVSKPWAQKYSPKNLDEVVGNHNIIETLHYYLENQNIPNMIVTGPNGVGKQTAVKAVVRSYLGDLEAMASLTIYGSINRGKDVVSEKIEQKKNDKSYIGPNIMNFIKRKLSLPEGLCKIIVIYDFDHMTKEAQMALRRIIELYSERVRFIFTCNNISDIIEAIQSRCVLIKFGKILDNEITDILMKIGELEGVNIGEEVLELICLSAYGDLKQAINYLQILSFSEKRDVDSFYKIFNMPPLASIQKFVIACLNDGIDMETKNTAFSMIERLLNYGYNANDILDVLHKVVTLNQFKNISKGTTLPGFKGGSLDQEIQIRFLKAINQCFYLIETSGSIIHLHYLVSQLIMIQRDPKNVSLRPTII